MRRGKDVGLSFCGPLGFGREKLGEVGEWELVGDGVGLLGFFSFQGSHLATAPTGEEENIPLPSVEGELSSFELCWCNLSSSRRSVIYDSRFRRRS